MHAKKARHGGEQGVRGVAEEAGGGSAEVGLPEADWGEPALHDGVRVGAVGAEFADIGAVSAQRASHSHRSPSYRAPQPALWPLAQTRRSQGDCEIGELLLLLFFFCLFVFVFFLFFIFGVSLFFWSRFCLFIYWVVTCFHVLCMSSLFCRAVLENATMVFLFIFYFLIWRK